MNDAAVITYLTNASGTWRTAAVPRISTTRMSRCSLSTPMVGPISRSGKGDRLPRSAMPTGRPHWRVQVVARPSALLSGIVVGPDDAVYIGYTRVRDRYPDDLFSPRVTVPSASTSGRSGAADRRPVRTGEGVRGLRCRCPGSERPQFRCATGVAFAPVAPHGSRRAGSGPGRGPWGRSSNPFAATGSTSGAALHTCSIEAWTMRPG